MNELLEKEKKKDKYLLLFFVIIFLFAAFALAYYFWLKNQPDKDVPVQSEPVVMQQRTQQPQPQISEEERLRREVIERIQSSAPPTTQQEEVLFKCTDPATGAISLAHTCPRGFTAQRIETQNSTGVKPARLRRTSPSTTSQQGQITVIPDVRREIQKCEDYYNPKIRRIIQIGYTTDEHLRRQLTTLQENKEKCLRAAHRGKAKFF